MDSENNQSVMSKKSPMDRARDNGMADASPLKRKFDHTIDIN